jgi:hypothetical protein
MAFSRSSTHIEGEFVDGHAVVELPILVAGKWQVLRCLVDTGCKDELVFSNFEDASGFGISFIVGPRGTRTHRDLANGTEARFVTKWTTVSWFGERAVQVLAPDPFGPSSRRTGARPVMPRAVIGTDLLERCRMTIDFVPAGRVLIEPLRG